MGAVMGGVTLYAPVTALDAWLAAARPGAVMTYATGPSLDPGHEVKQLVWEWHQTGEVLLRKSRHPVTGELLHQVQRRAPGQAEAAIGRHAVPVRRPLADDDYRETAEGKVFLALARAANMGLPCPTNAQLADVAGLRDADAASYQIKQLVRAGRIVVRNDGASRNSQRQVTIVETGRRTVLR